jgi:4-hydroxy-3-methylbut-2-en-1-yl diphosphate reductase
MATIEIDKNSGFCMGVVKAIGKAETFLENEGGTLYSLGDIVHNSREVERLESRGMKTIDNADLEGLKNANVLFRAHGEPPLTYEVARKNNINLIDATCPVVLNLQSKIRHKYENRSDPDTQIVLFGKKGHAEVVGLLGQTDDTAIVLEKESDLEMLDFSKPILLFSQTTMSLDGFQKLVKNIRMSMKPGVLFKYYDTICRQVANRLPLIREFAGRHDIVLFVSGAKSSNGKSLFQACSEVNSKTFFVTGPEDLKLEMIAEAETIGICGATSTPLWLMKDVKNQAEKILGGQ